MRVECNIRVVLNVPSTMDESDIEEKLCDALDELNPIEFELEDVTEFLDEDEEDEGELEDEEDEEEY